MSALIGDESLNKIKQALIERFNIRIEAIKEAPKYGKPIYDLTAMMRINEASLGKLKQVSIGCPSVNELQLATEINNFSSDKFHDQYQCETLAQLANIMAEFKSEENKIWSAALSIKYYV